MAYFPGTQSFRQGFPRTRTKQGGNNRRAMTANGLPNLMARGLPVPGRAAGNRQTPTPGQSDYQSQIQTLFRGSSDRPGKGGYQTLSDTFKALRRDMSLEDYQATTAQRTPPPTPPTPTTEPIANPTRQQAYTGGLGSDIAQKWLQEFASGKVRQNRRQGLRQAGRQATRQATRQETRTPNLSDAGFGSGASLSGVTDFDTWAQVMRNPQYQAGRDAFLAGPGMEEQLARDGSQGIHEQILGRVGLNNPVNGTSGGDGLMQYATPSTLFDSSGNLIAPPPSSVPTSTFTPPTSPINLGGFGSGAFTAPTSAPAAPAPTFSFTPDTKALQEFASGDERQAARQEQRQTARQDFRQGSQLAPGPAPAPAPGPPGNNAGTPGTANPMADEYQQALARMGLPLDAVYEMLSNQARSERDVGLMNVNTAYDTQKAQAELQNLLSHRGIDENAAARGLFGSGIEKRNERLQNTDYTQGLLGLLQQKQLGTQGAYTGYANSMQQAVLDLASRQMQDPYSAVPNYYDWMTGESTIANEQGGGGADRLARLRELLRTGDLNDRQRERIRTRAQGLRG